MVQKQYGHLLFDAIRETLENMAFAEVVPQSMIIGEQEFIDDIRKNSPISPSQEISEDDPWGTSDPWGESPAVEQNITEDISENVNESIGGNTTESTFEQQDWGTSFTTQDLEHTQEEQWAAPGASDETSSFPDSTWENPLDSWGESLFSDPEANQFAADQNQVDFDILSKQQQGWCWSCLKVNSPELDAVWFVIPQDLLKELAKTMYAAEENMNVDTALMRDIIAELTNVIGGRLMLLLEELVGKFTLEVPLTGVGLPDFGDKNIVNETVICKVLVDGAYPVLSTMSFRQDVSLQDRSEEKEPNMSQK